MQKRIVPIFHLLLLSILTASISAQNKIVLQNPSFENPAWTNSTSNFPNQAPPSWNPCSVAPPSTTIAPSPDAYPLTFGPSNGGVFMGIYVNGDANNGAGEGIYQELCKPMIKDSTYTLSIDVREYAVVGATVKSEIAIYGSNTLPVGNQFTAPERLYVIPVNGTTWTTITCTFKPTLSNYKYFIIAGSNSFGATFWPGPAAYAAFDNIIGTDSTCGMELTSKDTTICSGSCANLIVHSLDATPPIKYSWNGSPFVTGDSAKTGVNAICGLTANTTYTVVGIDAANDTAQTVIKITVQQPTVTASPKLSTICLTDSVQLNATGALTYNWSPGTALSNTSIFNPKSKPTAAGNFQYIVTGTDALGCKDKDTVNVVVLNPTPTVDLGSDKLICPSNGDTAVTLNAGNGGDLFFWSTGATTSTIVVRPTATTTYKVVVSNTCGTQTASDEIMVTVKCGLEIPNVITPNGDLLNQYFEIDHMDMYPNSRLEIYDRWGLKMYESDNYQNEWDGGNFRTGKPVPNGVYYYILYLSDKDKTVYKGFITVLASDINLLIQ